MPVQIDPATGERVKGGSQGAQIDPATGERISASSARPAWMPSHYLAQQPKTTTTVSAYKGPEPTPHKVEKFAKGTPTSAKAGYYANRLSEKVLTPALPYVAGATLGAASGGLLAPLGPLVAGAGATLGAGLGGSIGGLKEGVRQAGLEAGGRVVAPIARFLGAPVARGIARKLPPQMLEKAGEAATSLQKWAEKYPVVKSFLSPDPAAERAGETVGAEAARRNAINHLTAAAAEKGSAGRAYDAIGTTIGNIEDNLTKLPAQQRTVQTFQEAVANGREALHNEYGNALGPHAREPVNAQPIAQAIRELEKDWMNIPGMGDAEKSAIKRAATQFERPMTVGQLDSLRQKLNTDLASIYAKAPNARYTSVHGSINTAIDNAIAKGARDVLYPIADRSVGQPAGYFADAMNREKALIDLREILTKRVEDLGGAQAISEVTPRLGKENIFVAARAGSVPRAGISGLRQALMPPRELAEAGKHVQKAFPSARVSLLPYDVLLTDLPRAREMMKAIKNPPAPRKGVAAALTAPAQAAPAAPVDQETEEQIQNMQDQIDQLQENQQ
jgi:hypothetical protein